MSNTAGIPILTPDITLEQFMEVNWKRNIEVFKTPDKTNLYWITALVEELGEIAGPVKKLERGFNPRELLKMQRNWNKVFGADDSAVPPSDIEFEAMWEDKHKKALAGEMAGLFIYLALMAKANDINLWEAVIHEFNLVTQEMQSK